eukprot:2934471-Pyramimonas_sp.AAC.1
MWGPRGPQGRSQRGDTTPPGRGLKLCGGGVGPTPCAPRPIPPRNPGQSAPLDISSGRPARSRA